MVQPDDQELWLGVTKDHLKSFEVLFRKFYSSLYRYAFSIVRNETVAEEITQEIFLYLWEKRKQIELKSSLKAYLFSSVRNKSINYIKIELPRLQATSDLSDMIGYNDPQMDMNEEARMKQKIQQAIDQLPQKCRDIFVLSRYGGLTYAEIAEELDLSIKTVENQMTIALRKLKEALWEELKEYRIK